MVSVLIGIQNNGHVPVDVPEEDKELPTNLRLRSPRLNIFLPTHTTSILSVTIYFSVINHCTNFRDANFNEKLDEFFEMSLLMITTASDQ